MNPQLTRLQVQAHTAVNSEQHSAADTRLHGRWLILARLLWCATFVLSLAYFVVSMVVNRFDPVLTLLLVAATSVWFAVSAVLFWRKSHDRVILLFSLALMLVGGIFLAPFPAALYPLPLVWELPLDVMGFLAQAAFLVFYLFPDGRFVPRWTRWLALGWIAVSLDGNLPSFIAILNAWNSPFSLVLYRLIEVAFISSLGFAQLYRYRYMSSPVQRLQTKWVVFAFAIVCVSGGAALLEFNVLPSYFSALGLPGQLAQLISALAFWLLPVLIPLSIGIALLRYRLWGIDVIINRTLVYAALTGTLVVVYIACILTSQALLSRFTSGNTVALVGSTLAIAALFQPFRRRIQTIIDRRFYRRKYDAARTIAAFSATLRGELDLNTLSEQLVAVVQETMQPAYVSLWLQRHDRQAQQQSRELVTAVQTPSQQPIAPITETNVAETSEEMPGPSPRGISRRAVIIGLAAGGVVLAGGGLSWWLLKRHAYFTYTGHSDWVYDVAWSPDGTRLASCSKDKTVQIWDATGGNHVFTYHGHKDQVVTVAWSPDGTRLASGGGNLDQNLKTSDTTVQVWDATGGGHVFTYHGHTDAVESVAWSPDGKRIVSGSNDKTAQVWDAIDGGRRLIYRGHTDQVFIATWSTDGKRIASGSLDNTVQVWDPVGGNLSFKYTGHTGAVLGVAWSLDDKRIASASFDKTAQVWDATDGSHVFVYSGHTAPVITVAWSPDGKRIASSSSDTTVQVWSPG